MLNVGIIGASFARDAYLPAFAHIDGAKVVALASGRMSSARAAAEINNPRITSLPLSPV